MWSQRAELTSPDEPEKSFQHLDMAGDLLPLAVHVVKLALGVVRQFFIEQAFFGIAPWRQGSHPCEPDIFRDDHIAAVLFVVHPKFSTAHMEDHEESCFHFCFSVNPCPKRQVCL